MAEPSAVQRDLQEKDHGPNGQNSKNESATDEEICAPLHRVTIDGGRSGIHMSDRQGGCLEQTSMETLVKGVGARTETQPHTM